MFHIVKRQADKVNLPSPMMGSDFRSLFLQAFQVELLRIPFALPKNQGFVILIHGNKVDFVVFARFSVGALLPVVMTILYLPLSCKPDGTKPRECIR